MLARLVSDATRLREVTALRCTMNQPDMLYQCLRGSSVTPPSSWGFASVNRPIPVTARTDGRPFRSRNSPSLAANIALLSRLEEKKLEAETVDGTANVSALIRSVLLESQLSLRHHQKELLKSHAEAVLGKLHVRKSSLRKATLVRQQGFADSMCAGESP